MLTFDMLNRRWPHAPHDLVEGIVGTAVATFAHYGLDTPIEQADLLAQISEETDGGVATSENLNYSAVRLMQVWPTRFPTLASASPYAHSPRVLADYVYGGRGGNRPGSDDGWRYRGRGAMQTTFHDNYAMTARVTGLDCLDNPDLVSAPANILACACAFWQNANLNPVADAGDFPLETLRLNGGYINLATRLQWRTIWRQELGVGVAPHVDLDAPIGGALGVQRALNRAGASPALIEDGLWGRATRDALRAFQAAHPPLDVDGLYGPQTAAALQRV